MTDTIKLSNSQKELLNVIIDKLELDTNNHYIINVSKVNELLNADIKSTRSRLSSVNFKKLFIYHNQAMVGQGNETFIELKDTYTIEMLKDLIKTQDTKD